MSGNLSEIRLFLVELRKEIGDDIEISVRCSGPSKYALRGKEWIVSRNWEVKSSLNWPVSSGSVCETAISKCRI